MPTPNPAAAEATGEPEFIPFDFDGHTFHVLPTNSWRFSTLRAFEEGRMAALYAGALSPASYDLLCEVDYTVDQLNDFTEALRDALGLAGK